MKGRIIKGVGGLYVVSSQGKHYNCKARGKFRHNNSTPMVGDEVCFDVEKENDGVIGEICPRVSELIRPFVSNVTQAFVVFTVKSPDINLDLLNRFLVLCQYNNLNIVLCINKMDLVEEGYGEEIFKMLDTLPYDKIYLNCHKDNMESIKCRLKDHISVFCGPSGVGKSTILNSLIGVEHMETGDISIKLKRGKHTTRHAELIEYEEGFVVDTPGFSSIKTDFIEKEELQNCFPEIRELAGNCKFSNCMHHKEPGCSVKLKVGEEIHPLRYQAYIKILEEIINTRRY
ncbi:ribosome biogenesis GTPase [Hathewaya proteolytica DSM 3090]|uniref:Small ribosomal subunit biogenesis GTPase RsgA n=1 Tax=Hathewaya proteolytica DSM 3090 TaxID=1121331 RepID=A0A1M6JA72_9CLOT|nr:ribosome small subunit-dependent GTPase A [Hathewaya proteolytica]SHJ43573.1 ribosome biogenesis GTPase [Hathewaya proteolytica DSM 3090]